MFKAMKYTDADEAQWPSFVADDAWVAEQKMDGTRVLAVVTDAGVAFLAGDGKTPIKHTAAMQHFDRIERNLMRWFNPTFDDVMCIDGELLIRTGQLFAFDLPYATRGGRPVCGPETIYIHRKAALTGLLWSMRDDWIVHVVRSASTTLAKTDMLLAAERAGVEGLVFKRKDGLYEPGIRSKNVQKAKFVKTADVVVLDVNRGFNDAGREVGNITFGFFTDHGWQDPPEPRVIGKCSAIGKPQVEAGDVIEIAYLYRDETGGLVQPRMRRIREDKDWRECDESQFPSYSREAI